MSARVHLHIGPRKTGTTYLQRALVRNQRRLAGLGVWYPTGAVTGHRGLNHERALLDASEGKVNVHTRELKRNLRRGSGEIVLSGEAVASCTPEAITRLMAYLKVENVSVIITARAWDRVLPSLWQQHVRNGRVSSYSSFLREATRLDRLEDGGDVVRPYAYTALVRRWLPYAERISLVTVPREISSSPDILWSRFLTALGVDPLQSRWDVSEIPRHDALSACESFLLREVNAQLEGAGRSVEDRRDWAVKLTEQVFAMRSDRGAALRLPPDVWSTVVAQTEDVVAGLSALENHDQVSVVGDLDDLRTPEKPPATQSPARLSKELVDLAGLCIAHLHASRR